MIGAYLHNARVRRAVGWLVIGVVSIAAQFFLVFWLASIGAAAPVIGLLIAQTLIRQTDRELRNKPHA